MIHINTELLKQYFPLTFSCDYILNFFPQSIKFSSYFLQKLKCFKHIVKVFSQKLFFSHYNWPSFDCSFARHYLIGKTNSLSL